MEPRVGFGLTTFALPRQRSNQLSYRGPSETDRVLFLIVQPFQVKPEGLASRLMSVSAHNNPHDSFNLNQTASAWMPG
jgi:hypothetical protein